MLPESALTRDNPTRTPNLTVEDVDGLLGRASLIPALSEFHKGKSLPEDNLEERAENWVSSIRALLTRVDEIAKYNFKDPEEAAFCALILRIDVNTLLLTLQDQLTGNDLQIPETLRHLSQSLRIAISRAIQEYADKYFDNDVSELNNEETLLAKAKTDIISRYEAMEDFPADPHWDHDNPLVKQKAQAITEVIALHQPRITELKTNLYKAQLNQFMGLLYSRDLTKFVKVQLPNKQGGNSGKIGAIKSILGSLFQ